MKARHFSSAAYLSVLVVAVTFRGASAEPIELAAVGTVPPPKFDRETQELFSGNPLKLLGPGKPGGNLAPVAPGAPGAPAESDSGGGMASLPWSKIIAPENLEAQIKSQLSIVQDAVKTKPNFASAGREKAQVAYMELASLFTVIAQYDGDVRWKKDAVGLRNKFSQVARNCKTMSDASYNEAKLRSEDLNELVRGGSVDLPKGEFPDELGKLIDRPVLMRRFEESRTNRLAPWTSDKGSFGKNKDALMREAQLMAMFAELIKNPTFDSGDEGEYKAFAEDFKKQCLELVEMIKTDNQAGAQSTVSRISKSCDTCHGTYR